MALISDARIGIAVTDDDAAAFEVRADHLADVLSAVGQHDEQLGARLDKDAHRWVQGKAAKLRPKRAVARLARGQHVLAARCAQPSRQPGDLRRLTRAFHSLEGNEHN